METSLSLSQVIAHPDFIELQQENELLRSELSSEQLAKVALKNIDNMQMPFVLKNRLVMNEGMHNNLFYTKSELMNELKFDEAGEFNLVCDHADTRQKAGVRNYAGAVLNRHWSDSGPEGPGTYADLEIRDEDLAKKLAMGAKFGVSPTFDYDPVELDGQEVATNLTTISYSLVLDPAVRKTMLNEKQGRNSKMNSDEKLAELAELEKKKLPYKFPYEDKKKKKIKEEVEGKELDVPQEIMVDEPTHKMLQAMEARNNELQQYKDNIEKAELQERAENIVINEFIIGRVEEGELDERLNHLMSKNIDVLDEVGGVIGDHVELSAWTDFVKKMRKKDPKMSFKQISVEFKKQKKGSLDAGTEGGAAGEGEPAGDAAGETTPEGELNQLLGNSQAADTNKRQSELDKAVKDRASSELDAKMAAHLFGGGAK